MLHDLRRQVVILHHKRRIAFAYLDIARAMAGATVRDESEDAAVSKDVDAIRQGFDAQLAEIEEANPEELAVLHAMLSIQLADMDIAAVAAIVKAGSPEFLP